MLRARSHRIFENADEIWRFEPFVVLTSVQRATQARGARARGNGRNEPLIISSKLVQKFFPRGARNRAQSRRIRHESTESLQVIRPRQMTEADDGGRKRRSTSGKIRGFALSCALHRPPSVFKFRACS
jgi:hypothetical protein